MTYCTASVLTIFTLILWFPRHRLTTFSILYRMYIGNRAHEILRPVGDLHLDDLLDLLQLLLGEELLHHQALLIITVPLTGQTNLGKNRGLS